MSNSEPPPTASSKLGNDCYSDGERVWMEGTQAWRAKWLRPILAGLTSIGITANYVTAFSFLLGLLFLPLWFYYGPVYAFIALAGHVITDGIDGALARHQNTASGAGSFTDSVVDQCIVMCVTLTTLLAGLVSIEAGTVYLFAYTLVVAFAMVRNAMQKPFSWLVRPRFYVYGWIIIELYYWPGSLEYLMWISTALLAFKAITGFHKIRLHLKTKYQLLD